MRFRTLASSFLNSNLGAFGANSHTNLNVSALVCGFDTFLVLIIYNQYSIKASKLTVFWKQSGLKTLYINPSFEIFSEKNSGMWHISGLRLLLSSNMNFLASDPISISLCSSLLLDDSCQK